MTAKDGTWIQRVTRAGFPEVSCCTRAGKQDKKGKRLTGLEKNTPTGEWGDRPAAM
jgi:hypothetical protein